MAKFAATSTGHLSLSLMELDAVGIKVLRDGELFQTFGVTIHKPDRVMMRRDGEHETVSRTWLWRGALAAGAEMLPSLIQSGLADGSLPTDEPRVAREITVPMHRIHELCEHSRTLPEINHAHVADFKISGADDPEVDAVHIAKGTGPASGPPEGVDPSAGSRGASTTS